ncbi:MAG: sugar phosphate isomerase/epimerase family protein [Pseudonocardiaceae bacterium]
MPTDPPTIAYAGIGDEAGVSLQTQLDALARLDWSVIELRTVDGTAVADLDNQAFTQLVDALAAHRVTVAGVASRIGNWSRPITGAFEPDLAELAILTHRCAALGTRYIRVMSYLNAGLDEPEWGRRVVYRMRELASQAERADLVLLHENCTGWAGTNAERMLELLDAVGSPALRLLFDTGNGIAYGYQAYDMLTQIISHVAHVHVKDAEGSTTNPIYTLPGTGQARLADCLRLLLASGYAGVWSIEPHLSLRPHESGPADDGHEAGQGRHDGFVACGLALEQFVLGQVLPAFPAWSAVPGGLGHADPQRALSAFSRLSGVNEV